MLIMRYDVISLIDMASINYACRLHNYHEHHYNVRPVVWLRPLICIVCTPTGTCGNTLGLLYRQWYMYECWVVVLSQGFLLLRLLSSLMIYCCFEHHSSFRYTYPEQHAQHNDVCITCTLLVLLQPHHHYPQIVMDRHDTSYGSGTPLMEWVVVISIWIIFQQPSTRPTYGSNTNERRGRSTRSADPRIHVFEQHQLWHLKIMFGISKHVIVITTIDPCRHDMLPTTTSRASPTAGNNNGSMSSRSSVNNVHNGNKHWQH